MKLCRFVFVVVFSFFGAGDLGAAGPERESGKLTRLEHADEGQTKWKCSTAHRTVFLELNPVTQWMEVDMPSEAHFSGTAVKSVYREGGSQMVYYSMQNAGFPYFYEFGFLQDTTLGKNFLALKFGANQLTCKDY